MPTLKEAVLSAVKRNSGQWSWYQLDRALSAHGLDTSSLMESLAALEAEGHICVIPVAERPGMPLYAVASSGAQSEV